MSTSQISQKVLPSKGESSIKRVRRNIMEYEPQKYLHKTLLYHHLYLGHTHTQKHHKTSQTHPGASHAPQVWPQPALSVSPNHKRSGRLVPPRWIRSCKAPKDPVQGQLCPPADRNQASHPAVVSVAQGSLQSQAWPPGWKTMWSDAQKAEALGMSYLGYTSTSPKLMCSFLFLPSLAAGFFFESTFDKGPEDAAALWDCPWATIRWGSWPNWYFRTADSKLLTQCDDLVTHNYNHELNKNRWLIDVLSFWHRNLSKKSEFCIL